MENSWMSCCNTNIVQQKSSVAEEEEESGWTAYLDDFSYSNNEDSSFVSSNPSLISDAAWNGSKTLLRRLNFNNHRKYSCDDDDDDDYKDTACSPVNSPKVSTMKQMEVNYMKSTDDNNIAASGNFLGKQAMSNNFWKQEKKVEDMDMDKLRKRGLCLVPVSALTNYLG